MLPWLRSGEPGVAQGRSKLSRVLVIMQLAFSVLLLTSAGLAYRSLALLDSGQPGFNTDNLLLVTVRAGRAGAYVTAEPSAAEREAGFSLIARMRERLAALGDVASVTYSRRVPNGNLISTTPVSRDRQAKATPAIIRPVGPDYLHTLGLAPSAGRDITTADRRGGTRVAVINQHLAAELFGAQSPLGHTLLVGDRGEPADVIGVAPNALFDGPLHDERPRYLFLAQQQASGDPPVDPTFFIRHRGSLESATAAASRALAEVDSSVPIVAMSTMNARLESVTVIERMIATLLMAFALASLVVAALGQYAVAMFNMRRRTKDFGVRMAIGASSSQIQRDVIAEAFGLTWRGLVIGFLLSVGVGLAAGSVLFGVTPTDPLTYSAVFLLLAVTSLTASYVPAWRAGRVNVVEALRQE